MVTYLFDASYNKPQLGISNSRLLQFLYFHLSQDLESLQMSDKGKHK